MRIINVDEARGSLNDLIDLVVQNAEVAIIARADAPDAVMMSLAHYRGLLETVELLNSPANAAHLARSIEQMQNGRTQAHQLIDVSGNE